MRRCLSRCFFPILPLGLFGAGRGSSSALWCGGVMGVATPPLQRDPPQKIPYSLRCEGLEDLMLLPEVLCPAAVVGLVLALLPLRSGGGGDTE